MLLLMISTTNDFVSVCIFSLMILTLFIHKMYGFPECKSSLNPLVVYSTDRFKAVVPVLVLLFVALWFILRGDLFLCFTLCCVFQSF